MVFNLMKKVVITGGANGIGLECVKKFSSNNYLVFILDKERITEELDNVIYYNCDISDYNKTLECSKDIIDNYGNIDILINCAGIQSVGSFSEYNYDEWLKVFKTNYFGTCNTIHAFIDGMNEYSTILNIISVHSAKPRKNKYAYDSSKSAVEQLTKELALDFSERKVTINALSFGHVNTNMNKNMTDRDMEIAKSKVPLNKIFEAYEIANIAFDLISNFSKYTTGSTFIIDGGRSLI